MQLQQSLIWPYWVLVLDVKTRICSEKSETHSSTPFKIKIMHCAVAFCNRSVRQRFLVVRLIEDL